MIKLMFYGNEVKWPVYLETKQAKNYSNGSGRGYVMLNDKQFARALKKFQKHMEKQIKESEQE